MNVAAERRLGPRPTAGERPSGWAPSQLDALAAHARDELAGCGSARAAGARPDWIEPSESVVVRPIAGAGETRRALVSLVPRSHARCAPSADALSTELSLSAREAEVALLAAQGFSVLNVASRLGVAESTVRTYVKRVYAKLDVRSRAELACRVLGGG